MNWLLVREAAGAFLLALFCLVLELEGERRSSGLQAHWGVFGVDHSLFGQHDQRAELRGVVVEVVLALRISDG